MKKLPFDFTDIFDVTCEYCLFYLQGYCLEKQKDLTTNEPCCDMIIHNDYMDEARKLM